MHDTDTDRCNLDLGMESVPSKSIVLPPDEFDRFVRLCESETPHEIGQRLRDAAKRLDEEGFDV